MFMYFVELFEFVAYNLHVHEHVLNTDTIHKEILVINTIEYITHSM